MVGALSSAAMGPIIAVAKLLGGNLPQGKGLPCLGGCPPIFPPPRALSLLRWKIWTSQASGSVQWLIGDMSQVFLGHAPDDAEEPKGRLAEGAPSFSWWRKGIAII